jgi:hypothetical protein
VSGVEDDEEEIDDTFNLPSPSAHHFENLMFTAFQNKMKPNSPFSPPSQHRATTPREAREKVGKEIRGEVYPSVNERERERGK